MRAETQKKLGRTEEGPMKTLASVFERFGGEAKIGDAPVVEPKKREEAKEEKPVETEVSPVETQEANAETKPQEETQPIAMEDIDKKLDQLLEDDLKQV